jgi:alpha,alpha-trehalase
LNHNQFLNKNLRAANESDWENSSRWVSNEEKTEDVRPLQLAPVDLNALLYHLEKTLAKAYKANEQPDYATSFENLAKKRKTIFDTYFWDDTKGFYFDYDFLNQKRSNVFALSGVFPLFVGLANEKQASKIAYLLEKSFLKPGGLSTTLNVTGLINDAPYGRADLQWIAISGLRNYRKNALADKIKSRWIKTNSECFFKSGELLEFYNVVNPEKNGVNINLKVSKIDKTSGVLYKLLKE